MNPWSIILDFLDGYPILLPLLLLLGAAPAMLVLLSDSANRRAVNILRAWKGPRRK